MTSSAKIPENELSPHQGYALSFRAAMDWLESANNNACIDLVTLITDMEVDGGHSHDPAMLYDWVNRWGPLPTLTSHEAMRVAYQFVEFERGWSEEPAVKRLIEEFRKTGEGDRSTLLWRAWHEALPEVLSSAEPLELTSAWVRRSSRWRTEK